MDNDAVVAGQAIYSKRVLSIYDLWVLGFSNRFVWRCPTPEIGRHFLAQVSSNHLDVGVGTGYYLKHYLPQSTRRIALLDLNKNSLESTSIAIAHLAPESYCHNILEPIPLRGEKFDSISLNYLLHCLPGSLEDKAPLFGHLKAVMNPGGVIFGSTILGKDVSHNWMGNRLMAIYNRKGIFSNYYDSREALESSLKQYFDQVRIEVIGRVALFSAQHTG